MYSSVQKRIWQHCTFISKTVGVVPALLLLFISAFPLSAAYCQDIKNSHYVLYPNTSLIQHNLSKLPKIYQKYYAKYIPYKTPNGGIIPIIANKAISDEQLLRAYNILAFYLTDVPHSRYGTSKAKIANEMAKQGAVLIMPNGADGDSPTPQIALKGQPLYQKELPTEGSKAYIDNDYRQRDAGFEEIFHMVHDYGIGTRQTPGILKSTYQVQIQKATSHAMKHHLWPTQLDKETRNWMTELQKEGSLEQEYIASVIDSYYGLWGAYKKDDGGMWGLYIAKTRKDIKRLDPMGYALMQDFFSSYITYMARIDPQFLGTFSLKFDPKKPYTYKSQYLIKAHLLGQNNSALLGNDQDNVLMGNKGDNILDGGAGTDVVQYQGDSSQYTLKRQGQKIKIQSKNEGTDTLVNIEILRFIDKDILAKSL